MGRIGQGKLDRVRAYIREHPNDSISETCHAVGCSHTLVSIARREITRAKLAGTWVPPEPKPEPDEAAALLAQASGQIKTPEDQARFLSALMDDPAVNDQTRVSASNALRELQRQTGQQGQIGPAKPITLYEVRSRLADLLEGVGKDLARLAWLEAFRERPKRGVQCSPATNGSTTPSSSSDPTSAVAASPSPELQPSAVTSALPDGAVTAPPPEPDTLLSSLSLANIVPPPES